MRSSAAACGYLLDAEDGLHVVAEAGDVPDAVRHGPGASPGRAPSSTSTCPAGSSLEAIRELHSSTPETAIVVLTMQNDPAFARRGAAERRARLRAQGGGRRGAPDGDPPRGEGRDVPEPAARRARGHPAQRAGEPPADLTAREVEVLRRIALGHTNVEIAEQLYLSVRTIETHRAHVQQKLQRSSRAELVQYALANKLVSV